MYPHTKRSFVYSAVTQFDTTNTSNNSTSFGGAGSGVIFGLVSFACGGLRFDSSGVSLLFSGRGPALQNNMVASNVTRWLRVGKVGPTQRTLTKVNLKVTQRTKLIHDLPQTRFVLRCRVKSSCSDPGDMCVCSVISTDFTFKSAKPVGVIIDSLLRRL
jgi:hypothetical protein